MSEWFYIWLALGSTWGVFAVALAIFNRKRIVAERALRELRRGDG